MNPATQRQQQCLRGPINALHWAAFLGSTERTMALLATGSIDIDHGTPDGWTPLMIAAQKGHSQVAQILLGRGADLSIAEDNCNTALHISAQYGHHAVTVDLIKAGAELEARTGEGVTPLELAATAGHSGVMAALIEAGADVDSRSLVDGCTPLYMAAHYGRVDAVKELLGAKANPLLARTTPRGKFVLPLESAALTGHPVVVQELIQQIGIEGCGGDSGGVLALELAASRQHVDIMAILTDAGVVDTGIALVDAAACGREAAVKFLLQQRQLQGPPTGLVGYVNFRDPLGMTPLFRSVDVFADGEGVPFLISPKVVRLLIDAGADTSSAVRVTSIRGAVFFNGTPLAFTNSCLREKAVGGGTAATEEQMYRLEAVRRLLLRVEAVHAVSWLWHREPQLVGDASEYSSRTAMPTPASATQLASMLPMLRRRRRGALLGAVFRYSSYP